ERPFDRESETRGVESREGARGSVREQIAEDSDLRADRRRAAGHRLDGEARASFAARRADDEPRAPVDAREILRGLDPVDEARGVADPALRRALPRRVAHRAAPDEQ